MTAQILRRDLTWGIVFGAWASLIALMPPTGAANYGFLAIVAPVLLIPLAWWVLCGVHRWAIAFLAAAVLLPPLPLPWGDAGPHPSMVFAALGIWAGLARGGGWRFLKRPISVALCCLWLALLISVPWAAVYSGAAQAAETLVRIALFSISPYLFFYLTDGPGPKLKAGRLLRLLFWSGLVSAAFACLDFYFQFPAPARFAEQFVWLQGGVFRRAQGVFYEASTLGLFCVFLLLMIAAGIVSRRGGGLGISTVWLLAGGAVFLAALLLSFSRTALVGLALALAVMAWLEVRRRGALPKLLRSAALVGACAGVAALLLYWLVPQFLEASFQRLWYSGVYFAEAPNLVLSRRLESWLFLLEYLRDNPWRIFFGIGYKTLPYTELLGSPVIADNMYLSLLIETGLPGLAALLMLHVAALRLTYRLAVRPRQDLSRVLGLWMFSFWWAFALQMASGDVLTYWRILPAFFAVLALAVREAEDDNPVSRPVL